LDNVSDDDEKTNNTNNTNTRHTHYDNIYRGGNASTKGNDRNRTSSTKSNGNKKIQLNWRNGKAANYLQILIAKYGEPTHIHSRPGGHIIWDSKNEFIKNSPFDRIELRDEPNNYVRHYITYHIKKEMIPDVDNLTKHIEYNESNNHLWGVSNSDEQNIAGLALATYIGQGAVSLGYLKANRIYEQWLSDTRNPRKVDHMYDLLVFNIDHQ
jgi:hypothetical protein